MFHISSSYDESREGAERNLKRPLDKAFKEGLPEEVTFRLSPRVTAAAGSGWVERGAFRP